MRYAAAEKLEIIRLVERSPLPMRHTPGHQSLLVRLPRTGALVLALALPEVSRTVRC